MLIAPIDDIRKESTASHIYCTPDRCTLGLHIAVRARADLLDLLDLDDSLEAFERLVLEQELQ